MNIPEQRLVTLILQRDRRAPRILFEETSGALMSVAVRYLRDREAAEDVLQDAYIKIFGALERWEYRGPGSLVAWMKKIVVNESLKALDQRRKSHPVEDLSSLPDLPDEEYDESIRLTSDEIMQLVRELPEGYRTVFNLYVIEGRSHIEIGKLLHISPDSSASQLHRAKKSLIKSINMMKKEKVKYG